MMMDQDLKAYLDVKFESLEDKVDGSKEDIKKHSQDISQLYDMDRDKAGRIDRIETYRENHEEFHKDSKSGRRFSLEMMILIGLFAADKIGSWIQQLL